MAFALLTSVILVSFGSVTVAEPRSRRASTSDDPNLYEVLSLTRSATIDEIRKRFKKLSRENHPDLAPESKKEEAVEKFKWIKKAHEILKDTERRREYDQTGLVDPQYHRENQIYQHKARATLFEDGTTSIIDVETSAALSEIVSNGVPTLMLFWTAEFELQAAVDTFKSFSNLYKGVVRVAQFNCESFPTTCRKAGIYDHNNLPAFAVVNPRKSGTLINQTQSGGSDAVRSDAFMWLTRDNAPLLSTAVQGSGSGAGADGVRVPPFGAETATRAVREEDAWGVVGRARRWLAADARGVDPNSPSAPAHTSFPFDGVRHSDVAMEISRNELAAWAIPFLSALPRAGMHGSEPASCPSDGSPALLLVRLQQNAVPLSRFTEGAALRMLFQGLVVRGSLQLGAIDCPGIRSGVVDVPGGAEKREEALAICDSLGRSTGSRPEWADRSTWTGGYAVGLCGMGPYKGTRSAKRAEEAVAAGKPPTYSAADAFDFVHLVESHSRSPLNLAKQIVQAFTDASTPSFPSNLVPQTFKSVSEFESEVYDSEDAWLVTFSAGDWCSWCVWVKEELKMLPLTLPDVVDSGAFDIDNVRVGVVNCMPNPPGHGLTRAQQKVYDLCKGLGVYSFPKVGVFPTGKVKRHQKAWHNDKRHAVYLTDTVVRSAAPVALDEISSMKDLENVMSSAPKVPAGESPVKAYVVLFTAGPWCGPCTFVSGWWPVAAQKVQARFPDAGIRLATVNCDNHRAICSRVGVTAYPTIKLRQPGDSSWKELGGDRSPDGVADGIAGALFSPILHVTSHQMLKDSIVGDLKTPVMVLFTAGDWCPPCIVAKRAYTALAAEAAQRIDFRDGSSPPPRGDTAAVKAYLSTRLPFYQVNCDDMQQSCSSFLINAYPDLVARREGLKLRKSHYDSNLGWDVDGVLHWMIQYFELQLR